MFAKEDEDQEDEEEESTNRRRRTRRTRRRRRLFWRGKITCKMHCMSKFCLAYVTHYPAKHNVNHTMHLDTFMWIIFFTKLVFIFGQEKICQLLGHNIKIFFPIYKRQNTIYLYYEKTQWLYMAINLSMAMQGSLYLSKTFRAGRLNGVSPVFNKTPFY